VNLTERLRGIVKPPAVTPVSGPVPVAPVPVVSGFSRTVEETLGGQRRGACFVVERRVDGDVPYGRTCVREIAERLEMTADHASMLTRGAPARAPLVFFDLETTGLNGGAGTYAFLVGSGAFDDSGSFVTKQYLMAKHADERAMLEAIAGDLASTGTLVSFNGKSFDVPVIETRYLFHRLQWSAGEFTHLDVLHPARGFWGEPGRRSFGAGGLGSERSSCSLSALEAEVLNVTRGSDVPGFEIPGRYFQFLRSGDARPLGPVLEHNRRDLLSLAALTARLLTLVARGPEAAADAREALALGRIYAQSGLDVRAREALTLAVELCDRRSHVMTADVRVVALHALALCERRARRYEDAASRWRAMLAIPACPPHLARQATEALAIHHEHRIRDLPAARTFALRSLDDGSTPAWREAVHRRVARISRKMEREGLLLQGLEAV
jgi:uncharacterized protein